MNISLNRGADPEDGLETETLESELEEHRKIMEQAGYNLTGNTALINEGEEFPGSYRVWLETTQDTWVYIDPEGNAIETECPISNPTGEEWKR